MIRDLQHGCQTFNPMPLQRGSLPPFRKHAYLGDERLLEVDPQTGDFRVLSFNRTVPCLDMARGAVPTAFGDVVQSGRLAAFVDAPGDLLLAVRALAQTNNDGALLTATAKRLLACTRHGADENAAAARAASVRARGDDLERSECAVPLALCTTNIIHSARIGRGTTKRVSSRRA